MLSLDSLKYFVMKYQTITVVHWLVIVSEHLS